MDVRHRGKSGLAAAAGTDDGDDFNANAAAAELGSLLSYPILLIHSINVLVSGGGDSFRPSEMMKAKQALVTLWIVSWQSPAGTFEHTRTNPVETMSARAA